jgi:tRNA nucleotidyltransferase (CCA-adding enzyme)
VDPYGGRADLEAGLIRVLHPLSFIEDPTRIFRAVRYENRYGFRMDAHTLRLAHACVEMGLVGDLSGARLREELVAILEERHIRHSLARLCELHLDEALHPGLECGAAVAAEVEREDELRERHAPELPVWRLRLAALVRRLPAAELEVLLGRLRTRRRDARVVAAAAVLPERLRAPLAAAARPADVGELLDPQPLEVAIAIAALDGGAATAAALAYLTSLRFVQLEVNGRVLQDELGLRESPLVGRLLEELLRRKRNGELEGRADELAAARELVAAAEVAG